MRAHRPGAANCVQHTHISQIGAQLLPAMVDYLKLTYPMGYASKDSVDEENGSRSVVTRESRHGARLGFPRSNEIHYSAPIACAIR